METVEPIGGTNRAKKPGGGQRKGVPHKRKPHGRGFGYGSITAQEANAKRWSKDRRAVVAMAQEVRPEAFNTIVNIMRDPLVEAPTRVRCGELILAYSDGKPRQSVDIAIGGPREMSSLSRAELEAIARGAPVPYQLAHNGVTIEGEAFTPTADAPAPLSEKAVSRSRKGISPGA